MYIYTYTHTQTNTHTHTHTHTHTYIYIFIYVYLFMNWPIYSWLHMIIVFKVCGNNNANGLGLDGWHQL